MKNSTTRFFTELTKINTEFIIHVVTKSLRIYDMCIQNLPPSSTINPLTTPTSSTSSASTSSGRRSERLSSPSSYQSRPSWVYPNNICNISGKSSIYEKKAKNTVEELVTISTRNV